MSTFSTALDGLNKINNSNQANKASAVIKDAGTVTLGAPNTTRVAVAKANEFVGTSNDQITVALVNSTGVVGNTVGFAIGTGVGAVDQVRKNAEVVVGNANIVNSDPLHDKKFDREVLIQGTGYRQLRNGTWVDVSGTVVTAFPSATGFYGTDENTLSRATPQSYDYRLGLSNIDKSLETRTG